MNRTIVLEYLKTIIFSIFASVAISAAICFFFFFNNHTVDNYMPQYLIQAIEQNIEISDGEILLDNKGLEKLNVYHLWMQVVDTEGNVNFESNVPEGIPHHYSNFELVNYVLNSNQLGKYTVYAYDYPQYENYGILIGCDSNLVTKHTFSFVGNEKNMIWKCSSIFLSTTFIVIILASYHFSKKVTSPISKALENIEKIQTGHEIRSSSSSCGKMFKNVFVSIEKLQAALKENEILRAEWISNISHDIKTPLSTIKGYAEMLSSNDYDFAKEEIILYSNEILKSAEKLKNLIDDLKTNQMLVEGKFKLNLEKVELTELLKICIKETETYIKNRDTIDFTYDKEVEVLADRKLLERCFVNIICNAYVHNKNEIHVEISLLNDSNGIKIAISDNGKGMTSQDMNHIFERYYRGTDSGTVKGTGLGLAIAKEVIITHDGTLDVVSILGNGTKFLIYLPIYNLN